MPTRQSKQEKLNSNSKSNFKSRKATTFMGIILAMFLCLTGIAGETKTKPHYAVIDVDGIKSGIELKCTGFPEGGSGTHPVWRKPKTQYLSIVTRKLSEKWQDLTCSFIPEQSGSLKIILRGNYIPKIVDGKKTKEIHKLWIEWKNLSISGAEFKNIDFSELGDVDYSKPVASGKVKAWNVEGKNRHGTVGKFSIKTCFKAQATQEIKVVAGQEVKIDVKVRIAQSTPKSEK